MSRRVALLLGLLSVVAITAAGQMRKADLILLAGDTDDAIRLAKSIKDLVTTDPSARRAVGWDVPPRLWPRFSAAAAVLANRIVREGAITVRRGLRISVRLQDAEMYRANADADGNVTVVFLYE